MMEIDPDLSWLDLKLEFDCFGKPLNVVLLENGEPVGRLDSLMSAKFESEVRGCGVWTLGLDALRVMVEHQTDDEG